MASENDKAKRWQIELATLLLIVLMAALICANVVPRYSTVGSGSEFVVKHWTYGFPFTYAENVESPTVNRGTGLDGRERLTGHRGTRNLLALAGDIIVMGLIVVLFGNRRLFFRQRFRTIDGRNTVEPKKQNGRLLGRPGDCTPPAPDH